MMGGRGGKGFKSLTLSPTGIVISATYSRLDSKPFRLSSLRKQHVVAMIVIFFPIRSNFCLVCLTLIRKYQYESLFIK